MHCDQVGITGLQNLLTACGAAGFKVQPQCNTVAYQGYSLQAYAAGTLSVCPMGYLNTITATVNTGVNLVVFASVMMGLASSFTCVCNKKLKARFHFFSFFCRDSSVSRSFCCSASMSSTSRLITASFSLRDSRFLSNRRILAEIALLRRCSVSRHCL